jgi:hypothetical protein
MARFRNDVTREKAEAEPRRCSLFWLLPRVRVSSCCCDGDDVENAMRA